MKDNTNLTDFNWDDDNTFFGTPTTSTEDTPPASNDDTPPDNDIDDVVPTEDDDLEDDTTTKTSDTDDVFFGKSNENKSKEDNNDVDDTPPNGDEDKYWNDVYSDFKDKGLFNHVELEEGEILDSERLAELQEQEYEAEMSHRLQSWAGQIDEDAQAFIKFKTQGGSTEDFFKTYQSSYELPTGEITNEDYQDSIIRHQLRKEGWDADEIEDRLEYLTTSKKKENVAKRYDTKLKKSIEVEKAELVKRNEEVKRAAKADEESFKSTIKDTLVKTQEVKGFKITSKDQINLYNLLTRKQYKTNNGKSITGFQKKIGEAFQNPEKMILLAKLVDSDFDMSSFAKKAETQTSRRIKNRLEQHRNSRPTNSGSSLGGGNLADIFK